MRRPHTARSGKRNRTRILKKGPGKRISRRARLESVALPIEVTASRVETSAAAEAAANAATESGAADLTPARGLSSHVALRAQAACAGDPVSRAGCGFGAVRVGPLLGRLRLHLQTERFLAVHRNDAIWEEGCMQAALALADIVREMTEAELDALLWPEPTPDFVLAREQNSPWGQGWGTLRDSGPARRTGTATLAWCSAGLQPGTHLPNDAGNAALKGSATRLRIGRSGSDETLPRATSPNERDAAGAAAPSSSARQLALTSAADFEPGSPAHAARARSATPEGSPRAGVVARGAR